MNIKNLILELEERFKNSTYINNNLLCNKYNNIINSYNKLFNDNINTVDIPLDNSLYSIGCLLQKLEFKNINELFVSFNLNIDPIIKLIHILLKYTFSHKKLSIDIINTLKNINIKELEIVAKDAIDMYDKIIRKTTGKKEQREKLHKYLINKYRNDYKESAENNFNNSKELLLEIKRFSHKINEEYYIEKIKEISISNNKDNIIDNYYKLKKYYDILENNIIYCISDMRDSFYGGISYVLGKGYNNYNKLTMTDISIYKYDKILISINYNKFEKHFDKKHYRGISIYRNKYNKLENVYYMIYYNLFKDKNIYTSYRLYEGKKIFNEIFELYDSICNYTHEQKIMLLCGQLLEVDTKGNIINADFEHFYLNNHIKLYVNNDIIKFNYVYENIRIILDNTSNNTIYEYIEGGNKITITRKKDDLFYEKYFNDKLKRSGYVKYKQELLKVKNVIYNLYLINYITLLKSKQMVYVGNKLY